MDLQENGGIYRESIRRFRRPIAHGCAREAYYSKKLNLIFKTPIWPNDTHQTEQEKRFFDKLPKKYLSLFPVVAFVTYNKRLWVVMKKIRVADSLGIYDKLRYALPEIERALAKQNVVSPNIKLVQQFLKKFGVEDLHCHNWGFDENWNIQIIDWGL